jgi:hypothetical protein
VYDAAPDQTRRAVLVGLVAWCVLDSLGSLAAGVPSNVLFNGLVLLTAAGPLWFRAQNP